MLSSMTHLKIAFKGVLNCFPAYFELYVEMKLHAMEVQKST